MSRKVGYDFVPVPTDIDPKWARLPFQTRMLGVALWMLGRGEPIPVPPDEWQTYLCGKLMVNGPDRPNIARALNRLVDAGLLTVCDRSATCLLRVCTPSAPCLHPVRDVSAERKAANTQESSSTEEKRLEERRRDEMSAREKSRAPLPPVDTSKLLQRPEDVGFRWVASLLGRSTFDVPPLGAFPRQYAWIGSKPEAERAAVKLAIEGDVWCTTNPHKVDAPHLERRWQHYLGGDAKPVLKPLAASPREEFLAAREASRAAQIEVNRLRDAPWFDKEDKSYPAQLERAIADLEKARAHESAITSQFRAVAS